MPRRTPYWPVFGAPAPAARDHGHLRYTYARLPFTIEPIHPPIQPCDRLDPHTHTAQASDGGS